MFFTLSPGKCLELYEFLVKVPAMEVNLPSQKIMRPPFNVPFRLHR